MTRNQQIKAGRFRPVFYLRRLKTYPDFSLHRPLLPQKRTWRGNRKDARIVSELQTIRHNRRIRCKGLRKTTMTRTRVAMEYAPPSCRGDRGRSIATLASCFLKRLWPGRTLRRQSDSCQEFLKVRSATQR